MGVKEKTQPCVDRINDRINTLTEGKKVLDTVDEDGIKLIHAKKAAYDAAVLDKEVLASISNAIAQFDKANKLLQEQDELGQLRIESNFPEIVREYQARSQQYQVILKDLGDSVTEPNMTATELDAAFLLVVKDKVEEARKMAQEFAPEDSSRLLAKAAALEKLAALEAEMQNAKAAALAAARESLPDRGEADGSSSRFPEAPSAELMTNL